MSGQYKSISGESFLTDVVQVIGGNGNGTAITKECYVLYWGANDAGKGGNSGGVIPNSLYKTEASTCETGPVFVNYCAGETGATEIRVDDAVAIARGDLFGFMVNKDGDFYTWGSTKVPGGEDVGALGIGLDKATITCFTKIEINCESQDLCPEAFMASQRYKCPGAIDSLYSGFTPIKGREDFYFFRWTKDGTILNSSTPTSTLAVRKADKHNNPTIEISEPGLYEVEILYIGTNVPCDNCPETKASTLVIDMDMPIDTVITEMNCVANPLKPSSGDVICFEAVVNDKFYKASDTVTFAAF